LRRGTALVVRDDGVQEFGRADRFDLVAAIKAVAPEIGGT
jgi:hypothetical protein